MCDFRPALPVKERKMKLGIKGLFKNLSSDKKRNIIILLGAVGMVLIFASNFIHIPKNEVTVTESESTTESITAESYRIQLENDLTNIVSQINGAGEVKIMITMDSTVEDVFAVERKIDDNIESAADGSQGETKTEYSEDNTYVTIKNKDGSEEVVLLKQVMPKIRGVLVVCDGGGNSVVQEKITQAVAGVLNISSGKVFVTD